MTRYAQLDISKTGPPFSTPSHPIIIELSGLRGTGKSTILNRISSKHSKHTTRYNLPSFRKTLPALQALPTALKNVSGHPIDGWLSFWCLLNVYSRSIFENQLAPGIYLCDEGPIRKVIHPGYRSRRSAERILSISRKIAQEQKWCSGHRFLLRLTCDLDERLNRLRQRYIQNDKMKDKYRESNHAQLRKRMLSPDRTHVRDITLDNGRDIMNSLVTDFYLLDTTNTSIDIIEDRALSAINDIEKKLQ